MHPRLAAVISFIDASRADLLQAVDAIPETLREARPSEDAWSTAEVLEHLMRVETGLAKLFALKIGELQATPGAPREAPEMRPVDLAFAPQLLNRGHRIEAPERVVPRGEMSASEARDALLAVRGALLDQLHAGDGLMFSAVRHPHPMFGELDLYEWVQFIGLHERRHTAQIREIGAHFSTSE